MDIELTMGADGSVVIRALPGTAEPGAIARLDALLKELTASGVKFIIEKPPESHHHSPQELANRVSHKH